MLLIIIEKFQILKMLKTSMKLGRYFPAEVFKEIRLILRYYILLI